MAKTKFSLQMFQFRIWHKETALINKLKLQYCIFVDCCANVLFKVRSLRIWKSTFPGDTARQLHNTNSLFAHVIKIYDDPCWFSIKLQSHPYVSSEFCFSFFFKFIIFFNMIRCLCYYSSWNYATHSTDARGQDHPAPFDEEDWFVPNHVFNIKVESVTTWKKSMIQWQFLCVS